MAKTISKDKGLSTRPRPVSAQSDAADAAVADDMRDEDMLASNENVVPDDVSDGEEAVATDGELVVSGDHAVTRRRQTEEVEATGVMGFLLSHWYTRFFAESYLELRKVTWPTPTDARNMSFVVIGMSALVALVLGLADLGLIRALSWLTTLSTGH